ncbi:unnamed protein product [Amaranthus hypochondriacus]
MRRSTRRSTMAVSIHNSLEFDSINKITTRRSSILPQPEDTRNVAGNFTTKFSMSSFVKKVEELTHDQRTALEKVGFGYLIRIHHHTLRKNLLVEWMERWDSDKRVFVLNERELTITSVEAALILGLRAAGKPVILHEDDQLSKLEEEYGATQSNRKISISAIERRLQSLGDLHNEDFVRTFLLFIFGTLLFPSSSAKVDSRYLSLLKDLDRICEYAWGVAVVEDLFNWLSKRKEEQTKSIEGCLILLQIWSYEHIDIGRPISLSYSSNFPRACRWESSRCNSQRHWFTTKFNELEENQVTWKLQPTATELNIDIIRELLVEEPEGEVKLSMRTNTTTSSITPKDFRDGILDEETNGGVGICKLHPQDDFCEDSRQSSEVSTLVEETETQEIVSTRRSSKITSKTVGLPPKSISRHTILAKESYRGMGRGKGDIQADIPEDSRQSTDLSVITEDYTECSSYVLQEDQIEENSHRVKGKGVLEFEKSKPNDFVELQNENAELKSQVVDLKKEVANLKDLEDNLRKEVANLKDLEDNLRKEVAELKEDNLRLRAPPPADNIERLIDAYFNGVTDVSDVVLL